MNKHTIEQSVNINTHFLTTMKILIIQTPTILVNFKNLAFQRHQWIYIPASGMGEETFNLALRLACPISGAEYGWTWSSSIMWKMSFRTKKPFSWGAKKNVWANLFVPLKSLICTEPVTITITPPFHEAREYDVLITIDVNRIDITSAWICCQDQGVKCVSCTKRIQRSRRWRI